MDAKELNGVVNEWLAWDHDEQSRAEVKRLLADDPDKLAALMVPRIAFGTAGLRAAMEPGFGRMNALTVRQASQGLARYTAAAVKDSLARGIVVGHDHRHNSREFAHIVLESFRRAGFKTHFLGLVHTPMVPFAISHLNAACGVMITASHNPAKDNGYKVYWENACQIIPPHDSNIAQSIDANLEPWSVVELTEHDLKPVDLTAEYFKAVIEPLTKPATEPHGPATKFKLVYTPMHGVGLPYAQRSLAMLGFDDYVSVVPEQAKPDPDFPTVKFPNPEEHGALDLAMKTASAHGAEVVLANDPDADRFTCAVYEKGRWHQLTGDQIGMLFADFVLQSAPHTQKTALLNSAVSSQVLRAQAEAAGVSYEETLSGFKWLGNKAIDLEAEGYTVPLAYEEAIGYMLGGHAVKDKDGISALHVFVQLLSGLFARSVTVLQHLEAIGQRVGFFATHNGYYIVEPSQLETKFERIRGILDVDKNGQRAIKPLKSASTDAFEPLRVTWLRDLTLGYDSREPGNIPKLPVSPSSQMITFTCENESMNARCTLRGSGTEPKLKIYIESRAGTEEAAQAHADAMWNILAREMFFDVE